MFLINWFVSLIRSFLYGVPSSRSSRSFNPISQIVAKVSRRLVPCNRARRQAKKKMTHLPQRFLSKRQERSRAKNRVNRRARRSYAFSAA